MARRVEHDGAGKLQISFDYDPDLVAYVKAFILCDQCRAPDTRFIKEGRTSLLKCQACGATRPVRL